MFVDVIKPEFTYEYSETTIDYTGKTLTAIFYTADKYFDNANSSLALSDLTIKVDGDQIVSDNSTDPASIRNTLTAEAYNNVNGNRIGTKYTLVVKNLPRTTGDPYHDYSGPVTIAIPADKISDLSGNKNIAKTITIGQDDPENVCASFWQHPLHAWSAYCHRYWGGYFRWDGYGRVPSL